MTSLRFTKMHGLGNDFMVVNGVTQKVTLTPALIRTLADRHFGIGFDQLLLVEESNDPQIDFIYRIFNADGDEVGQCGNGARCLVIFVREQGLTDKTSLTVATKTARLTLTILADGLVKVDMGVPVFEPELIPFSAAQQALSYLITTASGTLEIGAVSMGNPHCILPVADIHQAPIDELGPFFQQHPRFLQGANVGFLQVLNRHSIALRVYERGAGETLACGSGACAAVVYARLQNWVTEQVTVDLLGGQLLIEWQGSGQPVYLIGPATSVFEGTIHNLSSSSGNRFLPVKTSVD